VCRKVKASVFFMKDSQLRRKPVLKIDGVEIGAV
jgi:hypothetical protein